MEIEKVDWSFIGGNDNIEQAFETLIHLISSKVEKCLPYKSRIFGSDNKGGRKINWFDSS
ncbi:unnamed protein product [Acanthoscelides obtectus]|uniref:Uncharacterized protein n=1 Tax=Acanthoscelides obtectus TaxID=200917 RepID=A0A9P0P4E2_ACAOB|nr:unnamed protein product [Acanthoscelides obtectus]CAK1634250.1 hypothetical protein AOBTE_LOCUS8692 [Acanthoscelides obtectus]